MGMELAKPQLGQLRFSAGSKRARNRPTFQYRGYSQVRCWHKAAVSECLLSRRCWGLSGHQPRAPIILCNLSLIHRHPCRVYSPPVSVRVRSPAMPFDADARSLPGLTFAFDRAYEACPPHVRALPSRKQSPAIMRLAAKACCQVPLHELRNDGEARMVAGLAHPARHPTELAACIAEMHRDCADGDC